MKKLICVLFILVVVVAFTSRPVMAGGDKVRGDKGVGSVCQYQDVVNGDAVFDGDGCDE